MTSATITTKGQVTIPKEIRDYLKLDIGSKIEFVIVKNGMVKIITLNVPVTALSGVLRCLGLPGATIEYMELAIRPGCK